MGEHVVHPRMALLWLFGDGLLTILHHQHDPEDELDRFRLLAVAGGPHGGGGDIRDLHHCDRRLPAPGDGHCFESKGPAHHLHRLESVVLSGQGLLAGLTAAPSIPATQGLFLRPFGIPQESSGQLQVLLADSAGIVFEAFWHPHGVFRLITGAPS